MEAPERQYFIPQLGKGSTGPSVISDAGKVFQLQRRHFVRAAQPDLVDDPVEMGLEVLETAGWDRKLERKEEGSTEDGPSDVQQKQQQQQRKLELYPFDKVLFHLPPLVAWIEEMETSSIAKKGFFTGKVMRLFQSMQLSKGHASANEFWHKNVIRQICAEHCNGKMEDAQEWMMGILGKLHDEAVEFKTGVPKAQMGTVLKDAEYTSFMYRIFGGKLQTQISCPSESFHKNIHERFASLEVEVGKSKTVEEALMLYTRGEKLTGENQYRLEYGQGKQDYKMVDAIKTTTIHEAPNVLMVLLKRFTIPGMKVKRKVAFDSSLDIQPFLSESARASSKSNKYDLVGVVVHAGVSPRSGHYYSFAKGANQIWHLFDDESVTAVPREAVLNSEAYVLVYIKQQLSFELKKSRNLSKHVSSQGNFLSKMKTMAQSEGNPAIVKVSRTDPSKSNLHQQVVPSSNLQNLNGKSQGRVISNLFGTMKVCVGDKDCRVSHIKQKNMGCEGEKLGKKAVSTGQRQDSNIEGMRGKIVSKFSHVGDEHEQGSSGHFKPSISPLRSASVEKESTRAEMQSSGRDKSRKRPSGKHGYDAFDDDDMPASKRSQLRQNSAKMIAQNQSSELLSKTAALQHSYDDSCGIAKHDEVVPGVGMGSVPSCSYAQEGIIHRRETTAKGSPFCDSLKSGYFTDNSIEPSTWLKGRNLERRHTWDGSQSSSGVNSRLKKRGQPNHVNDYNEEYDRGRKKKVKRNRGHHHQDKRAFQRTFDKRRKHR